MSWNEKKLQQLQQQGNIRGYKQSTQKRRGNIPQKTGNNVPAVSKRSAAKDWLAWNLLYWANEHALTLEEEFRFNEKRKWRFDWAIPAIKCAVEYEGIFAQKSRHTTAKGFTGDTEKYNQAQLEGWRMIRLTALNYKTVLKTLDAYVA